MRIQHNISALNSYRNFKGNNAAVANNLEKLASGYRINRAADDAAGLAISEKMRLQITGLNTAGKNARDGISLVQTAEGALTEVHGMMNRMVEISTQSMNGVYEDAVDRKALQEEMSALTDEIDRIVSGTNFNKKKLLDGSLDVGAKGNVNSPATKDGTKAGIDLNVKFNSLYNGKGINIKLEKLTNNIRDDKSGSKAVIDNKTGDITVKLNVNANYSAKEIESYIKNANIPAGLDKADEYEKAIKSLYIDGNGVTGASKFDSNNKFNGNNSITHDTKDDFQLGEVIHKEIKNDGGLNNPKIDLKFEFNVPWYSQGPDYKGEVTKQTASFKTLKNNNIEAYSLNGQTRKPPIWDDWGDKWMDIQDMWQGVKDKVKDIINEDKLKELGQQIRNTIKNIFETSNQKWEEIRDTIHEVIDGIVKDIIEQIKPNPDSQNPDTPKPDIPKLEQSKGEIIDIEIGNLVEKNIKSNSESMETVTIDKKTGKITLNLNANKDYDGITLKNMIINAAKTVINDAGYTFTAKDGYLTALKGMNIVGSITGAKGMDAGNNFNTNNSSVTKYTVKDSALNLQIGDINKAFNRLEIRIADLSSKSLKIAKDQISVETEAKAGAALEAVNNAIEMVSKERGKLGAIQNRLEHTVANLSVTAENMTAAESRIRDTDMAKEMMKYTKNNILIQSSQAMMAQANQVPEGVLQMIHA